MFNLLVSGTKNSWETDQLMSMELGRFKEHSGAEAEAVTHRAPVSLKILEHAPALLMYELAVDGPNAGIVRYGRLRGITVTGGSLTFRFEDQGYVERRVVEEFSDRLCINRFEHNRTHWAVKDGDLPTEFLERLTPVPYGQQVTEITRRAIIDALVLRENSFHGTLNQMDFLKRVWNLASMPSTDHRFDNAEADIWQHTVLNEDWDVSYLLLEYLKLISCPDKTFLKFVEIAVHPLVGDNQEVSERLSELNGFLRGWVSTGANAGNLVAAVVRCQETRHNCGRRCQLRDRPFLCRRRSRLCRAGR